MKKSKRTTAKKKVVPKKHAAYRKFFTTGTRGARGLDRVPLHVLITPAERAKLVKLSHVLKLNCADVVRTLIDKAKV